MAVETRNYTPELTSTKREQFQLLRRSILDTQIKPAIRDAELFATSDQASEVASILSKLVNKLNEAVTRAKQDPTFGSYYLGLYEKLFGRFQPAAPDFHYLKRESFDRATAELFSAIQGDVPLHAGYSWGEIEAVYQEMGKHMPPLPEGLIYVGGPDDGVINDRVGVTLPTKAPFMFVDYIFRLWGRWEGSNQADNPVRPESSPESVAIQVVTLDQHYPYLGQRSLRG